jgi:hypothetical protein
MSHTGCCQAQIGLGGRNFGIHGEAPVMGRGVGGQVG